MGTVAGINREWADLLTAGRKLAVSACITHMGAGEATRPHRAAGGIWQAM